MSASWRRGLPTPVGAVNARRAWRKKITSLLDSALDRNDTTIEQVSAALATALTSREDDEAANRLESAAGYYAKLTGNLDWGPGDLCWVISNSGSNVIHAAWTAAGAAEKLVAAGHVPEVWGSANRAPSLPPR